MNNPDFAELKEKLTSFDDKDEGAFRYYADMCSDKIMDSHKAYQEGAYYQNAKSSAIITELLEIISLQNKEVESYARYIYCTETCHLSTRWSDHAKCTCGAEKLKNSVKLSLSETKTRLQKLREFNNG
jgi:hypothetical protein